MDVLTQQPFHSYHTWWVEKSFHHIIGGQYKIKLCLSVYMWDVPCEFQNTWSNGSNHFIELYHIRQIVILA